MKGKPALLTLLLCALSVTVPAQVFYAGAGAGYRYALKTFKNSSSLPAWFEDDTRRASFHRPVAGLRLGYQFHNRLTLEWGLQYANEGYVAHAEGLIDQHTGNIAAMVLATYDLIHDYYYLRVPLHMVWQVNVSPSAWRFSVFAGPEPGILTRQRFAAKGTNKAGERLFSLVEISDEKIKTLDPGFSAGLRLQYEIEPKWNVALDGSFYQGFGNILSQPKPEYAYDYKNIVNRHLGLLLSLQYSFF